MSRSEYFVLVLTERFNPRPNVGRVLFRVVRNASLGREEDARKFCAKLFFGIVGIPEAMGFSECGPIQPGDVSTPVQSIFKCRAFLARRRGGRRFQVRDGVGRRGGGLKMGWTKPLYDARPMGVEWFAESRM